MNSSNIYVLFQRLENETLCCFKRSMILFHPSDMQILESDLRNFT